MNWSEVLKVSRVAQKASSLQVQGWQQQFENLKFNFTKVQIVLQAPLSKMQPNKSDLNRFLYPLMHFLLALGRSFRC